MHTSSTQPIGQLLRMWRQRRRLSQLDLAVDAGISPRHLSFLETGRSTPSREMVLRLAEQLDLPLRERNRLLVAAGYAPLFPERQLDTPELEAARRAVDMVLTGHEPAPALAVDRHWKLVAANRAIPPLLADADPKLLQPPVNVIRLSLHPAGLAAQIVNYAEWRAHLLARLRRQIDVSADPALVELLQEVSALPFPSGLTPHAPVSGGWVAVPLRLRTKVGTLSFISTTTVFGTPVDVTLAELAIESFFPADAATAAALRQLVGPR